MHGALDEAKAVDLDEAAALDIDDKAPQRTRRVKLQALYRKP